jgi:TPP-dependent pyruvate/acetoin dehydrogenase alpha subunit
VTPSVPRDGPFRIDGVGPLRGPTPLRRVTGCHRAVQLVDDPTSTILRHEGATVPGLRETSDENDTALREFADPVALWRAMVTLRAYDERAVALSRQGRIGAYPIFWGEEAIQAGAVAGVGDDDWLFLSYRQNGLPILRGLPPELAWLYFRGDPQSFFDPNEFRCAPQAVPLATQLPHAVGWAWSRRRAGSDQVAVAFFGDGATSEGDFHEAVNLAGVTSAPVVFVCTNNQWAISTPFAQQTAASAIVDKAVGYGVRGVQVDGLDAVAVAGAVANAAAAGRAGDGPTLIEALSYRVEGHATADEPSAYRDPAEAERWREREPVAALERRLVAAGHLTDTEAAGVREEARARMLEAGERLDAIDPADPRSMIQHVLEHPPANLIRQFDEGRPPEGRFAGNPDTHAQEQP